MENPTMLHLSSKLNVAIDIIATYPKVVLDSLLTTYPFDEVMFQLEQLDLSNLPASERKFTLAYSETLGKWELQESIRLNKTKTGGGVKYRFHNGSFNRQYLGKELMLVVNSYNENSFIVTFNGKTYEAKSASGAVKQLVADVNGKTSEEVSINGIAFFAQRKCNLIYEVPAEEQK